MKNRNSSKSGPGRTHFVPTRNDDVRSDKRGMIRGSSGSKLLRGAENEDLTLRSKPGIVSITFAEIAKRKHRESRAV